MVLRTNGHSSVRHVRALEHYMDNLTATIGTFQRLYAVVRAERDRIKTRLYNPDRDSRGRFTRKEVQPAAYEGLLNDVLPEL